MRTPQNKHYTAETIATDFDSDGMPRSFFQTVSYTGRFTVDGIRYNGSHGVRSGGCSRMMIETLDDIVYSCDVHGDGYEHQYCISSEMKWVADVVVDEDQWLENGDIRFKRHPDGTWMEL